MTAAGRTTATLDLIARKLREQEQALDAFTGVHTLTVMVRYDRRTGRPQVVNLRPEVETG